MNKYDTEAAQLFDELKNTKVDPKLFSQIANEFKKQLLKKHLNQAKPGNQIRTIVHDIAAKTGTEL